MPTCPGCNCQCSYEELREHLRHCEHLQEGASERRDPQADLVQSTDKTLGSHEHRIEELENKIRELESRLDQQ